MSEFQFNFNRIQQISMCQELLHVCVKKTAIKLVPRGWCLHALKAGTFPFQASSQAQTSVEVHEPLFLRRLL